MAVRSAMHRAGAAALTELLRFPVPAADQRSIVCSCGQQAQYRELRSKALLTVVGKVNVSRPYYLCPHCHSGQFPVDSELDVENTEMSPGVRRMMAVVGQEGPFDQGRQQMELLAGLKVTTKAVERTAEEIGADIDAHQQQEIQRTIRGEFPMVPSGPPIPILYVEIDGTGVPVVKKETVGRKGKTDGQPAHTREAKLGAVFTQSNWDEKGYAIREPDSTTYTGAIETAEEFGNRIYVEAWKRGWSRAEKKVVIGDGAEWIWNIAAQHFPGAIQIVDLFHARQHLWELPRKLYPNQEAEQKDWMTIHQKMLDEGRIEELVAEIRSINSTNPELSEKLRKEADYFENHTERMRYPEFRRQHLFVGSGVIEAGCKNVIGSRCKQSGMFWTVRGANGILALRCCHSNGQFEDYWESRAA